MTEQHELDRLADELTRLGRALPPVPVAGGLEQAVMRRLATLDAPTATAPEPGPRGPHRQRWLAGAVAALAGSLLLVPPVRATLADWLTIGAVRVTTGEPSTGVPDTQGPGSAPTSQDTPAAGPESGGTSRTPAQSIALGSLDEARTRVGLDFDVPASLGAPTQIAALHDDRVAEIRWGTGPSTIILDILTGSPDYGFLKSAPEVQWVDLDGHSALWLPTGHGLQWIDATGSTGTAPTRTAGPTLVWVAPTDGRDLTYRLEGASGRQALALAREILG